MEQQKLYELWPNNPAHPSHFPKSWFEEYKKRSTLVKSLLARRDAGEPLAEFDIRAPLYDLHFDIAPDARQEDLEYIDKWLKPKPGETSADIAAGTGYLTNFLAHQTH